MWSHELGRSVEEHGRRPEVLAVVRAPTGAGESRGSALGKGGVGLPELCPAADGLLEVVADDLVALDESLAVLVEPVGEAFVQVGADGFRKRVVGGVADQQVTEAVAVVAGELSVVRADELPPDESREPGRDPRLLGAERLHGAAVEDLALHRAPLEHPALRPRRVGRGASPAAPSASEAPRPRRRRRPSRASRR